MRRIRMLLLARLLILAFAGCAGEAQSPDAASVLAELSAEMDFSGMVDMTEVLFEDEFGLTSADYVSAVYLVPPAGVSPEEVVIVEAADAAAADRMEEMLAARLAYKEKSAEQYLTEYLPVVKDAVLTREGNTIVLVIHAGSGA